MAEDGKVIFKVETDDSQVDKNLARTEQNIKKKAQSGEKEVKKSADSAGKAIDNAANSSATSLEKSTKSADGFGAALSSINGNSIDALDKCIDDAGNEIEQINNLLAKTPKNAELLGQKFQLVKKQISDTREKLDTLKRSQKEVEAAFSSGKISGKEYRDYQKEVIGAEQSLADLEKQLNRSGTELKNTADIAEEGSGKFGKLSGVVSGIGKSAVGVFAAIGTAAVAMGVKGVQAASDIDTAMGQFFASTGIAAKQTILDASGAVVEVIDHTEEYQQVLEDIYAAGYGEDFDDIAEAMSSVSKTLGTMDEGELRRITEDAFTLRDTFGYDVPESVRAGKAMITQFGISGEEAMSLIAEGAQNGLDYSGELIDNIGEYSVHFGKLGLSAEDMFNIFQSGADSGAWNLDKIGDAVKELSIRVIDGSETTKEGFAAMGLDADQMAAKFAAGGETSKDAFEQTVAGLASIEDPLKRDVAGVALFGTTWEDLGPDVVTQLSTITEATYGAEDAMESLQEVKYDNLGSAVEGLQRRLTLLLSELGESLIPVIEDLINDVFPAIEEFLPPLIQYIGEIVASLAPMIAELLPVLISLFQSLLPIVIQILEAVLPPLVSILDALLPILDMLLGVLSPILQMIFDLIGPILQLVADALGPLLEAIKPIIDILMTALGPALEFIKNLFSNVFGAVSKIVTDVVGSIKNILGGIVDFIKGVFTGNWKQAWQGIVNIFKGIINVIPSIVEGVINAAIGIVNGIIWGINKLTGLIGIPEIPSIPKVSIPRFKAGIDYVPNDFFPAYLDEGERVLTREENMRYNAVGGLEGMEKALSGAFSATGGDMSIKIEVPLSVDGREIARATAVYVGEQMNWESI